MSETWIFGRMQIQLLWRSRRRGRTRGSPSAWSLVVSDVGACAGVITCFRLLIRWLRPNLLVPSCSVPAGLRRCCFGSWSNVLVWPSHGP